MNRAAALISLLLTLPIPAQASELSLSGQIDFGFRYYTDDGLYGGQSDKGVHFFVGGKLDATLPLGPGEAVLQFSALNDDQTGRSDLNLTKAYYAQTFDNWDLLVGYNVENWGVAESRSVLNVLNPEVGTDLTFGRAQMGTPMINANIHTGIGTFGAYALLGFRQPDLPNSATRGRSLWASNTRRAAVQDQRDVDFALRFAGNYALGDGALDVTASYFNGSSRTPLSLPGCIGASALVPETACNAINAAVLNAFQGGFPANGDADALRNFLIANASDDIVAALSNFPSAGFIPYYQKVQSIGASAVYARGDLQLRFEAAYRKPHDEAGSFAGVIGGDYTFYNVLGDGALTVVAEYLYDDASARAPISVFDNDVFLGLNFSLNNTNDTRFTAGGFYDLDTHAQLYQMSLSTRINDSVRAELNAVHAKTDGWTDPLAFIRNDTFFELKLSTFF